MCLSKNYFNIDVLESNFKSSNKSYIQNFLNKTNINFYDILEIHNRPNYIKQIKKKFKKKIFLYFHNDPLSMDGSNSLLDRKYLIDHVDLLLFNSEWSRNRFFIGFDDYRLHLKKTEICFQSTNKIKIDFSKKKKLISFIGKLNKAKGFDIFGKSIIKILNKYKDWKAVVIGDEPRENMISNIKSFSIRF